MKLALNLLRNHPVTTLATAWGAQLGAHLAELQAGVQLALAVVSLLIALVTLAVKGLELKERLEKRKGGEKDDVAGETD